MIEKYVCPLTGNDENTGDQKNPYRSIAVAINSLKSYAGEKSITLLDGTHYIENSIELRNECSDLLIKGQSDNAVLLAGKKLVCDWKEYDDTIFVTKIPSDIEFDQLFINRKRQILARFPKFDNSNVKQYSGYIKPVGSFRGNNRDSHGWETPSGIIYDSEKLPIETWKKPEEGIIHIFQRQYWGNLQWKINNVDLTNKAITFSEGGFQIGAKWHDDPCGIDENSCFFIENIFEELTTPGEWYFDKENSELYCYPTEGVRLQDSLIEVSTCKNIFKICGTLNKPVVNVIFSNLTLIQSSTTFFDLYESPSLSDWSIHRGGAFFFENTENCKIRQCNFENIGSNAIFFSAQNICGHVEDCMFDKIGESAICFVGNKEMTIGSQRIFPRDCTVSNCHIHHCGVFGKQVAGVYVSVAKRIRITHNYIHDMPRAGICIGDGTWGGHKIDFNYITNTCLETGDHGPINAWGRDRYWCLCQSHAFVDQDGNDTLLINHFAGKVLLDAIETVEINNNVFKENAGWGIDLDDGASNYKIYNNLCIGVSIKLREGDYREIYNNIFYKGANSPCFHVGNEENRDSFHHNIVVMSIANQKPESDLDFEMGNAYGEIFTLISPPQQSCWLGNIDYNIYFSDIGTFVARYRNRGTHGESKKLNFGEWQKKGFDSKSLFLDPLFLDPDQGNFSLKSDSPAFSLGFTEFDYRQVLSIRKD